MIRVLAFSDFAPPETQGGVERTLREVYGRMVRAAGAEVDVVSLASGSAASRDEHDGVTIHRARRLPLERWTGMQVAVSPAVWRLGFAVARNVRPHLVHAHTLFFHTTLVAAAVARHHRRPLVLTAHVGALDAMPQPHRAAAQAYERTVGRALLSAADRIICVSDDVARHVRGIGADARRVTVIPNGVDLARFEPGDPAPDRRPTIVCVGRLMLNKGQHLLLEAAAALVKEGLDFRLVFAGDGPERGRLEAETKRRGLSDRVSFLGECQRVEHVLRSADLFVRPSLTEGMSLAVLEAMATGLPVVVSDVSGSRELIEDGVAGLIVPPGDPARLADALRRLLRDPDLRSRLGGAARARAEQFSWERVASATIEEFQRVAA